MCVALTCFASTRLRLLIRNHDPESYGATFPLTRSVVAGLTIGF